MRVVSFIPTSASGPTTKFTAISPTKPLRTRFLESKATSEQNQMTKPNIRTAAPPAAATTASALRNLSAFLGGWFLKVTAVANLWISIFLESLHETRRQQALYAIDRYRRLLGGNDDPSSHSRPHPTEASDVTDFAPSGGESAPKDPLRFPRH
jgi:hypothetical protein